MAINDAIGDRMKRYEAATRSYLPPRTYTIIRVDREIPVFTRDREYLALLIPETT